MKLLLAEDDKSIVSSLTEFLISEGFDVKSAPSKSGALKLFYGEEFNIALLDITLSDGDGLSLCREIKKKSDIPVIFLTARGEEHDIVNGLDIGADDYIAKPFKPRELVSRIKSVLRRYKKESVVKLPCGVTLDTVKGTVEKSGEIISLSALEYKLLLMFVLNRGILLTRERILEEIWDIAGDFVNDNTLTVYIKRIREKTEDDPKAPQIIKTVRGLGYRLD